VRRADHATCFNCEPDTIPVRSFNRAALSPPLASNILKGWWTTITVRPAAQILKQRRGRPCLRLPRRYHIACRPSGGEHRGRRLPASKL